MSCFPFLQFKENGVIEQKISRNSIHFPFKEWSSQVAFIHGMHTPNVPKNSVAEWEGMKSDGIDIKKKVQNLSKKLRLRYLSFFFFLLQEIQCVIWFYNKFIREQEDNILSCGLGRSGLVLLPYCWHVIAHGSFISLSVQSFFLFSRAFRISPYFLIIYHFSQNACNAVFYLEYSLKFFSVPCSSKTNVIARIAEGKR